MQFMLLIHTEEDGATRAPPRAGMSPEYAAYTEAMTKAGVRIAGDRLQPSRTAAVVRVRDGRNEVLDGPYADTKEQFAGYYLIDVPDIEQAVAWAARCPSAQRGTIEVRPVWQLS